MHKERIVKKLLGEIEIDTFLRGKKFQGFSLQLLKNKNTKGYTYNSVMYPEPGVHVGPIQINPGTSPP